MKRTLMIPATVLALAVGGAYAAEEKKDYPNFNTMDRDNDGSLTRAEAAANPKLADQFAQVDSDNDGKLSRAEYLAIMARQDLYTLRENLAEFINPEGKAPLAAGGGQASAGGTQAGMHGDKQSAKHGDKQSGMHGDKQSAGSQMPARAASPQLVRNVQQALQDKGIDAGPVDGIWGPRTHAGLTKFQKQQGFEASGQLNSRTLNALGIEGEQSASTGGRASAGGKEMAGGGSSRK